MRRGSSSSPTVSTRTHSAGLLAADTAHSTRALSASRSAATAISSDASGVGIEEDGSVGITDLLELLAVWVDAGEECELADLDLDGVVGIGDLLILLGNWG
jgi:hypothetical protein